MNTESAKSQVEFFRRIGELCALKAKLEKLPGDRRSKILESECLDWIFLYGDVIRLGVEDIVSERDHYRDLLMKLHEEHL